MPGLAIGGGAMDARNGRFLAVEDQPLVARALVRGIVRRGLGECIVASTVDEARRLLSDGSTFTALLIDIGLPDGSGLDVLAEARVKYHALTPAIVLSGSNNREHINLATALDAKYIVKPVEFDTLAVFLADAISLARRVKVALRSLRLSDSIEDIVKRMALGESHEAIAEARGTSRKTVENQIERAREQTAQPSCHSLIQAVLRDVARAR
jgi:DNA-binding NarL/FixJ family response regulator